MKPDAFHRPPGSTANRQPPAPQAAGSLTRLAQDISGSERGRVLVLVGTAAQRSQLAQAIATQLAYRIDLAGAVSKYIGETEKNLSSVFARADRVGSLLFFDEADALFSRRSEVKDAHDKFANLSSNFQGVLVLGVDRPQDVPSRLLSGARIVHVRDHWPPK